MKNLLMLILATFTLSCFGEGETAPDPDETVLAGLKSKDLKELSAALHAVDNRKLDSTKVRKALAELLADKRGPARIGNDSGILAPRVEAAIRLAKIVNYEPVTKVRPLGITDKDVTTFQEWLKGNPNALVKETKKE